jgi:hypothetical protein
MRKGYVMSDNKNPRPAFSRKLEALDTITLIGVVEDFDDDHLSIDLEPCSPGGIIIVRKSDVQVSTLKKTECPSGETVQLSTIKAKKETPIMKMLASTLLAEVSASKVDTGTIRIMSLITIVNNTSQAVSIWCRAQSVEPIGPPSSYWQWNGSVNPGITGSLNTGSYIYVGVAGPHGPGFPKYFEGASYNGQTIQCNPQT